MTPPGFPSLAPAGGGRRPAPPPRPTRTVPAKCPFGPRERAVHPLAGAVCRRERRSEDTRSSSHAQEGVVKRLSGRDVHRPEGARAAWTMERQVRLAAGSLVLAGIALGRRLPEARLLSAGVAGGLVFSALTDTCGMARLLAKLPHNRPKAGDLDITLAALAGRRACGPAG
ncbi:YgaP family membrane protein [Streptomyces lavendulocolor]|uniref:YgaP family membrane protein n=1 Tax=Streptomyces lavendulocolor TaxID=67316 RepID=UPI003CD09F64